MLRSINLECLLQPMCLFKRGEELVIVIPPEAESIDSILRLRLNEIE